MAFQTISILGCGWLGFPLAKELIKRGYAVKGSTTSSQKLSEIQKAGMEPFLIHANPSLSGENLDQFFQSDILILTLPFRRSLKDPEVYRRQINDVVYHLKKGTIQRLIFTSSTSVYPDSLKDAREDAEFLSDTDRSKVLYQIEQDLLTEEGFKAVIVRFAGLYGGERQIGKFLSHSPVKGSGDSIINLIHLDDCINLLTGLIEQGAEEQILNACSDEHPTRAELYQKKARELGLPEPEFDSKSPVVLKRVDNTKIKNLLNYSFRHPNPLN